MNALLGVCVLERDTHNNTLMAWQFPEVDGDVEAVALSRWAATTTTAATTEESGGVVCSRFKNTWLYTATARVDGDSERFPKVAAVAVVLLADSFRPARFGAFAAHLLSLYVAAGHPLTLLQCYLGVFCSGKHGGFELDAAKEAGSGLADALVRPFGEECVLLWVALVAKKRVAFVAPDAAQLLAIARALPALVPHRAAVGLWPLVTPTPAELADLRGAGVYAAGFVDAQAVADNAELFDVVADAGAQAVTVSAAAADDFTLSRLHKDVATFLTSALDEEGAAAAVTDAALEEGLALRMRSIVERLETLRGDAPFVTADAIRAQVAPPLDRFLLAVAQAEGLTESAQQQEAVSDAQQ